MVSTIPKQHGMQKDAILLILLTVTCARQQRKLFDISIRSYRVASVNQLNVTQLQ